MEEGCMVCLLLICIIQLVISSLVHIQIYIRA